VSRLFTQEDPIGIAGGLNLYGYANGDPINYSDPFGLTGCEKGDDDPKCEKGTILVISGEAAASFFSKSSVGLDRKPTTVPGILGAFGEVGLAFNLSTGASMPFAQVGGLSGHGKEVSVGFSLTFDGTLADVVDKSPEAMAGAGPVFANVGLDDTQLSLGLSLGIGRFIGVKKPIAAGGLASRGASGATIQRCTGMAVGLAPVCR
jgi:hypothetical protein